MTNCLKTVTKLQFNAGRRQKMGLIFNGTGIDIEILKNVYICIIKIYRHVVTFDERNI